MLFSTFPCAYRFTVTDHDCQYRMEQDGGTVLEISYCGGTLSVDLFYDAVDEPLRLTADAKVGDDIILAFYPYRVELYRNGELCDEEWPFGSSRFAGAQTTVCNVSADVCAMPMPPVSQGSFVGAEGWRPGGGVFVGDCMPFVYGDRYHVLYLKDRHHHRSKWGRGAHQWEHISTADLVHWEIHPMAVAIDDPMEGSICTGSHIYEGGRHYLYYTVRKSDWSPATIERSVSEDGLHYEKDRTFRFTLSEHYDQSSARDPKVIRGADGLAHMFVTTSETASGNGALAHLVSEDGDHWREIGSIYVSPDRDQPECSDYFEYRGKYYLIFSHHGRAQYRYSDRPFDGWIIPEQPEIPCSSVPKAGIFGDRIIFAGFRGIDGYAGVMTFMEADTDDDGVMRFFPVAEMSEKE
ncbi:MAG: hypothetical protein IKV66_14160 [Clostridia bacterium]|nr:hypothetical protein [Clostridia bacterium]